MRRPFVTGACWNDMGDGMERRGRVWSLELCCVGATNGNAHKHVTMKVRCCTLVAPAFRTCLGTYQQRRLLRPTPIFDNALCRCPPLSRFLLPIPVCNSTSPMLPSSHDTRPQSNCATSYTVTPTPSPGRH